MRKTSAASTIRNDIPLPGISVCRAVSASRRCTGIVRRYICPIRGPAPNLCAMTGNAPPPIGSGERVVMGRNNMSRKHLSFAIACALLVPPAAFAQAAAQDTPPPASGADATTLGGVTVTARKREETIQDVPVAVTAFTADALDRLNIEDISDLDAQVPNLTIYAARGSRSTLTA